MIYSIQSARQVLQERGDTTDMALFVRTSSEDMRGWDRQRIVDALLRETFIDRDTAEAISREVEELIRRSKIAVVTAP